MKRRRGMQWGLPRTAQNRNMKRRNCLFLNTGRAACSIVDEHDKPVPLATAKALWEAGRVTDYNLPLARLAMMDWDYEALKAYYAKGGRA